jgi:hypothetical protein
MTTKAANKTTTPAVPIPGDPKSTTFDFSNKVQMTKSGYLSGIGCMCMSMICSLSSVQMSGGNQMMMACIAFVCFASMISNVFGYMGATE